MSQDDNQGGLYEKHPDLTESWRNSIGPDVDLLAQYEHDRYYANSKPILWRKPQALGRSEQAYGEMAATIGVLYRLLTRNYDDAKFRPQSQADAARRETLHHLFQSIKSESMVAQAQTDYLAEFAELRWLEANTDGKFSTLPQALRARYTQTAALLDDGRLQGLMELMGQHNPTSQMEQGIVYHSDMLESALDATEQALRASGPLYGTISHGAMQRGQQDHEIALDIILPHLREELVKVRNEFQTIQRYATDPLALKAEGQQLPDLSNVETIEPPKRKPGTAEPNSPPPENSVVKVDFQRRRKIDDSERANEPD